MALEEAFKNGIKICEIDISLTADSVYVLFHDFPSVHRTSNDTSLRQNLPFSNYASLDAGYWKEQAFSGISIATLVDALALAEQYNAQVYLDIKDLSYKHIAEAIEEASVGQSRVLLAVSDTIEALEMKSFLPNAPWVWFYGGLLPDSAQLVDLEFYKSQVRNGCVAFEASSGRFLEQEPNYQLFIDYVHEAGAKVWSFTINDNQQAQDLFAMGVDAIETDRPIALSKVYCLGQDGAYPDSLITGNWRFTSSLNDSKGVGSQLRLKNFDDELLRIPPQFSTCSTFGISPMNGQDVAVMKVPAQTPEGGLLVYTNFSPEDKSIEDFSYTILLDILLPSNSLGQFVSIFQTSFTETSDAELFINPDNEIGSVGDYFGKIEGNVWTRLAWAYDGDVQKMHLYQDGKYLGAVDTDGNRWAVYNSLPPGERQGFLLFNDNDFETADIYVSALQIANYVMDSTAIKAIGAADADGFKNRNADLYLANNTVFNATYLDYGAKAYQVRIDTAANNVSQIPFYFDLSAGATANITSGDEINLSSSYTIEVVSEDGSNSKTWTICPDFISSVGEKYEQEKLVVYPNPTSNSVEVDSNTAIEYVCVYSLVGQELIKEKGSQVNLEAFPNGVYILRAYLQSGEILSGKVVKH